MNNTKKDINYQSFLLHKHNKKTISLNIFSYKVLHIFNEFVKKFTEDFDEISNFKYDTNTVNKNILVKNYHQMYPDKDFNIPSFVIILSEEVIDHNGKKSIVYFMGKMKYMHMEIFNLQKLTTFIEESVKDLTKFITEFESQFDSTDDEKEDEDKKELEYKFGYKGFLYNN